MYGPNPSRSLGESICLQTASCFVTRQPAPNTMACKPDISAPTSGGQNTYKNVGYADGIVGTPGGF